MVLDTPLLRGLFATCLEYSPCNLPRQRQYAECDPKMEIANTSEGRLHAREII